ncbi:hypothetical protein HNR26_003865 [Rhizobium rosettiformans]|uniref:Uncharacterized protein n=2 Tax=Rhizobium rosettiformans TaxID=1368430 RepID=A0A4S8PPK3_9HYPH|nr:hypothetical protein [Rhizobium rosettiformans]MBB5277776.1 hypothetical protein [Rhizobium rosettiformans]THV32938.1 hypothetical protein FAA86_18785 [Rhizobium rosettiformans W3]
MYFKVYDPKGEMFEVPAGRLQELIVSLGWTFWHPSEKKVVFKDQGAKTHEDESHEQSHHAV